MKKLTFFITFMLTLICTSSSWCMKRTFNYAFPDKDFSIDLSVTGPQAAKRAKLSATTTEFELYKALEEQSTEESIHFVHEEAPHERKGPCYSIAFQEFFNLTDSEIEALNIPGCDDWINELNVLQKYCIPVAQDQAQPGNLVIYASKSKNNNLYTPEHAAIYKGNNIAQSKFGTFRKIYTHPLWCVFDDYGDTAFIFKLDDKIKSKQQLFDDLYTTAQKNPNLRTCMKYLQEAFFAAAAKKTQPIIPNTKMLNYPLEMIKRFRSLRLNQPNKDGRNAMEIAAEAGNISFINVLLQHREIVTPSALELATKNNHLKVVQLLQSAMQKPEKGKS